MEIVAETKEKKIEKVETPKQAPKLDQHHVEAWISIIPEEDRQNSIEKLKTGLFLDLIKSMFSYMALQSESDSHVLFYFHVKKERQDLFSALVMNTLRYLKTTQSIFSGCLHV